MQATTEARTPTILVVDDAFENLQLMQGILRDDYRVKVAPSGQRALDIVQSGHIIDLILLDIEMPLMDGYEVIKSLKASPETASIPVVFISAKGSMDDEKIGLELGAVDYISKPISPPILLARVKTHIASKLFADFLRDKNSYLEAEVERRMRQMNEAQDAIIMAMASLAEARSGNAAGRLMRVASYARALAWKLSESPVHADRLTPKFIALLYKAAPLHDIGMACMPDAIARGAVAEHNQDFGRYAAHAAMGADALALAQAEVRADLPLLGLAQQMARSHHERWDGQGFPDRLQADEIPFSARVLAVAIGYEDLTGHAGERRLEAHEHALAQLKAAGGAAYDPEVVLALLDGQDTFLSISQSLCAAGSSTVAPAHTPDLAAA